MKKLMLLTGMGIGFVLGSKVGHGPYEQLEGQVRRFMGRPTVQQRIDQATSAASQQVSGLTSMAKDKLPGSSNGNQPVMDKDSENALLSSE